MSQRMYSNFDSLLSLVYNTICFSSLQASAVQKKPNKAAILNFV